MRKFSFLESGIFTIGSILIGSIGSVFTIPNIPTWYVFLNKPYFTPPSWLFGPVWTILFFLMGFAAYNVWRIKSKKSSPKKALIIFGLQFILNILWSLLFFGFKSLALGLVDIFALWIFIAVTIIEFWKIRKESAYLLFPYIIWVSFAAILNTSLYLLN